MQCGSWLSTSTDMTKQEKRNLLIAAAVVMLVLWLLIIAFGDVLGVSEEAKETIRQVLGTVGTFATAYIARVISNLKDTDGDGFPDFGDTDA